jgi:chromosome segregation ATPase
MKTYSFDTNTFYKNLENDINRRIHASTNCLTFTKAVGNELEYHLNRVLIYREMINKHLILINAPSKEEISVIANRLVDCEEKLDNLEETIYEMNQTQKKNNFQISKIKLVMEDLIQELNKETSYFHQLKIQTLEIELEELKHLFINRP